MQLSLSRVGQEISGLPPNTGPMLAAIAFPGIEQLQAVHQSRKDHCPTSAPSRSPGSKSETRGQGRVRPRVQMLLPMCGVSQGPALSNCHFFCSLGWLMVPMSQDLKVLFCSGVM
jgi:hypothetical protein